MKIVFVHGRSQEKREQSALQSEWLEAMLAGSQEFGDVELIEKNIELPFYGDVLFDLANNASVQDFRDLVDRGASGAGPSPQEQKFFQEVFRDMLDAKGISREEVALEVGGDVVERDIQNWKAVLAALRLLNRVPGVAAASIERWTRDVWLYITNRGVREKVDEIVEKAIPTDERCVIVAHSLGSIVAYSILRKRKSCKNIDAFVTLGSPLGIKAIYDRLPPNGEKRIAPFGAGFWYNARDKEDVVALHEIKASVYTGAPIVENYSEVKNSSHNQHSIVEYLHDKAVAKVIYEAYRAGQSKEADQARLAEE